MAKSKIIKELVNEEITIEKALKRILLLANDIENEDLKMWVEKELNGYESGDDIPEYRIINSMNLIYSGINGGFQVTRSPLPMTYLSSESYDSIKAIKIFEPIGSIQDKANNKEGTLQMDRTYLAGEIYNNTFDGLIGIQCMSISQVFDRSQFANIIKKVNLKALNILMRLEKEFGNLDELDIETKDIDTMENLSKDLKVVLYEDNSVHYEKSKVKNSPIVTDNAKVDAKTTKTKNVNSNTGKGNNNIEKHTDITTDIKSEVNIEQGEKGKKSWFGKLFCRKRKD